MGLIHRLPSIRGKTPFICALLDRLYRPTPYSGKKNYIKLDEITSALITEEVFAKIDDLNNVQGQALKALLSDSFLRPTQLACMS